MVPSGFVSLEAWPLNTSGKIDRKQLPEPNTAHDDESVYVAPRTVTEQHVSDAVSEVLRGSLVSVEDDLLGAGLTSLLAVRLSSLLGQ